MDQIKILNKIYKIGLYLLVSLIPLWLLPITQDILNFQKQALLVVLVAVTLVAWLAKNVSQQEISVRVNWLHVPVLAVVLITAISALLSNWRYGSIWGWPLNISDSFLTILFFAIFYFLVSSAIEEEKEIIKLLFVFVASAALAGIYAILQLYNVFILPFSFARITTFNTIGGVGSVAVLAAVLLPISMTMAFYFKDWLRLLSWVLTAFLLAIVLLVNSFNSWLVLAAGLIVLLVFGMWNFKNKIEFNWVSFPMVLLVVALFFLIFRFSLPGSPALPIEVSPSKKAEAAMVLNVLKQDPLFGTGPATFVYEYAKYHPVSVNQTVFWGTRFTSGASEILDWFITKGILGGISLIALIITAIVFSVRRLIKQDPEENKLSWMIEVGMLASFFSVAAAQVIYYSNFVLSFLFWMLLAGLLVFWQKTPRKISIAPPSILSIVSSFVFLVVLVAGVAILFIGGQKYVAEVKYLNGVRAVSMGDVDVGITKILSAARLNSSMDFYWRDLAQLYLSKLNQITGDQSLSEEQRRQQAQVAITNATISANRATIINPANVQNWNVRGFVYRNLIGIEAADTTAIESYNKAMALEPNSPFSFAELGRVYLIKAQALSRKKAPAKDQQEALNNALENLNKALSLKADYAPAHYLIALVYDEQGKSDEVISKLEDASRAAQNDIGLAFQLGVIYYQKDQLSKAQVQFERAKILRPNYSNARYMLGLVYDRRGQTNKAIEEFTKVSELNPDNAQLKKILDNLSNGKPALTRIQQDQPPIQDSPSEIKEEGKK